MPATYKDNGGSVNGSNKVFTYDFPVLQTEDVQVSLNGTTQATTKYAVSLSPANITFNDTSVDSTVQESDGSPKTGVTVRVYRKTTVGKTNGNEDPKAVFAAGSSIRASDLNANVEQSLFGIHELQERPIQSEDIANDSIGSFKLKDDAVGAEHIKDLDGNVKWLDNKQAIFGTDSDFKIKHDGTHGSITVEDGDLDLSSGNGDIDITALGDITIKTNPSETAIFCNNNQGVELSYNGNKRIETTSSGIKIEDNLEAAFGTQSDLVIKHTGTVSDIKNTTGELNISCTSADIDITASNDVNIRPLTGENGVLVKGDGKVELYFDDIKKFETSSNGAKVTGKLTATEGLANNTVTTASINNAAVTTDKLADDSVGDSKLRNNSVTTDRINSNAVTNDKVANDAIGIAELSATGSPSSSTYLRGDNVWATVSGGGGGGDANQNAFSNIAVSGQDTVSADTTTDTVTLVGGTNVTITTNASSDEVTITSTDTNTTYSVGDGGLTQNNFTNTLKTKLDGIAASANNYSHPNHSGEVTSSSDGATTIASNVVDEDNLKISNSPSAGKFLQYKDSTDELTWAVPTDTNTTDLVSDTSPQLGGSLDVNSQDIVSTSNGDIDLDPDGSGKVVFKGNATKGSGQFKLNCENNSHGIIIKGPPHSAAASYTLTLPNTDGSANQVLKTDGSGNLDWVAQTTDTNTQLSNAEVRAAVEAASDSNVFTDDDHTKLNGIAASANNYVHPNHSGEVTSTADGATVIADNVVDEANLKVSNAPTNGYFLQAQSGNTGGLTWAEASGGGGGSITSDSDGNTVAGTSAGEDLASGGTRNTFFGKQAGKDVTTGDNNVAIGDSALQVVTTSSNNIAIGKSSLAQCTGGSNIALGTFCLDSVTSGEDNLALGYEAGGALTTGGKNIAIGYQALKSETTASDNLAIGYHAGKNYTAINGCFIGHKAGENLTDGNLNMCIGYHAGRNNGGIYAGGAGTYSNTWIGASCASAITGGNQNVGIGANALQNNSAWSNVAIGNDAGISNTSGTRSTFIGRYSGTTNTTGSYNFFAGYYAGADNTTGSNNTFIGDQAGHTGTNNLTTGNNNTLIGSSAAASSATVSNEITIGDSNVTSLRCQVQTISSLSDERDKTQIEELPVGLDFVNQLKPVKFKWKSREGITKDGTTEAGFIAQDFQKAQKDNDVEYLGLVMDNNPDRLEASYSKLIPVLCKAIQELKQEIQTLKQNG